MTEDEAKIKSIKQMKEMGNKMCPLLGEKCVTCECISYSKPRLHCGNRGEWESYPPFCCNALNDFYAMAEAIGDTINRELT